MASAVESQSDRRGDWHDGPQVDDVLVKLYRCATVVKGGRRFSFGALVVVGDRRGRVGFGYGKANEVPPAVEKGVKQAKRRLALIPMRGTTLPHRITGRYGASKIVLIPAAPGTGVIAGSAARAVLELAGIKDVLTKCYGSTSPKNLVKATLDGLTRLRTRSQIEALRGVTLDLPKEPDAPVYADAPVDSGGDREGGRRDRRGGDRRGGGGRGGNRGGGNRGGGGGRGRDDRGGGRDQRGGAGSAPSAAPTESGGEAAPQG